MNSLARRVVAMWHGVLIFTVAVIAAAGSSTAAAQDAPAPAPAWRDCGVQAVDALPGGAFEVRAEAVGCHLARKVARAVGRSRDQVLSCAEDTGCVVDGWHCTMAIKGNFESGYSCQKGRRRIHLEGAGRRSTASAARPSIDLTGGARDRCLPADEADVTTVAEEISPLPKPLDDPEIEQTFRYPAFRISAHHTGPRAATILTRALSYRGPAGLYGSPIVSQTRFARMGIEAGCPAYLSVEHVVHENACWLTSEGNKCQVKWWPARGPNCLPEAEGGTCSPVVRRVSLGRPIHIALPRGPNQGLVLQLEIPPYVVPGKCVCVTNHLPQQHGGFSNVILVH